MKIGLRLGVCMVDIVKGKVKSSDVLALIINSKFDPRADVHWKLIWDHYYRVTKIWDTGHHEDVYKFALRRMYNAGKIHQPKIYGGRAHTLTEAWVDIVPRLTDFMDNVAAQLAEQESLTIPDILI